MARGRVVRPKRSDPGKSVKNAERRARRRERVAAFVGVGRKVVGREHPDPTEDDAADLLLEIERRLESVGICVDLDDDTAAALKNGESVDYYAKIKGKRVNSLSIVRYRVTIKGLRQDLVAVAEDPDADNITWIFRRGFEGLAEDSKFKPKQMPLYDRAG